MGHWENGWWIGDAPTMPELMVARGINAEELECDSCGVGGVLLDTYELRVPTSDRREECKTQGIPPFSMLCELCACTHAGMSVSGIRVDALEIHLTVCRVGNMILKELRALDLLIRQKGA